MLNGLILKGHSQLILECLALPELRMLRIIRGIGDFFPHTMLSDPLERIAIDGPALDEPALQPRSLIHLTHLTLINVDIHYPLPRFITAPNLEELILDYVKDYSDLHDDAEVPEDGMFGTVPSLKRLCIENAFGSFECNLPSFPNLVALRIVSATLPKDYLTPLWANPSFLPFLEELVLDDSVYEDEDPVNIEMVRQHCTARPALRIHDSANSPKIRHKFWRDTW